EGGDRGKESEQLIKHGARGDRQKAVVVDFGVGPPENVLPVLPWDAPGRSRTPLRPALLGRGLVRPRRTDGIPQWPGRPHALLSSGDGDDRQRPIEQQRPRGEAPFRQDRSPLALDGSALQRARPRRRLLHAALRALNAFAEIARRV